MGSATRWKHNHSEATHTTSSAKTSAGDRDMRRSAAANAAPAHKPINATATIAHKPGRAALTRWKSTGRTLAAAAPATKAQTPAKSALELRLHSGGT